MVVLRQGTKPPLPSRCSGLHSSAGWLALISLIWLMLCRVLGLGLQLDQRRYPDLSQAQETEGLNTAD